MLLFLCELFLPEGLADDSAEDSALVAFSPLVDFFELFVLELDGLPVVSGEDSPVVPCVVWSALCRAEAGDVPVLAFVPCVALPGDALSLAAAEAVAAAVALGEALAEADALGVMLAAGDALIPTDALALGEA
jgi:hypothetical protein